MPEDPLVSIVTPTYNAARFLEETIQSVLNQDYQHIEYIVIDGGSTDGSLDILRRYEGRLRCYSGPDAGQTDAINKGFLQSTGSIFAFLCADDTYLRGAVSTAVGHMLANPGYAGVYGEGYWTDEAGMVIRRYPTKRFDVDLLKSECFICQPTSFLWRQAFAEVGMLDPKLHAALDYEFWIRLAKRHRLLYVEDYLATSRMHYGSKTLSQRRAVFGAGIQVVKKHYGYAPYDLIYGYCCSVLDKRDGFFEPVPPSLAKYLLSLAYGSYENRRHLLRFWNERLRASWRRWRPP